MTEEEFIETQHKWWRDRYQQIKEDWSTEARLAQLQQKQVLRDEERPEALSVVAGFLDRSIDLGEFRSQMQQWAPQKPHFGFQGPAGQMTLNQLCRNAANYNVEARLRPLLQVPSSQSEALTAIDDLAGLISEMRANKEGPARGRAPFFLSWIWWLQQPDSYRPMWPSSVEALESLGWFRVEDYKTLSQAYDAFCQLSVLLDGEDSIREEVLMWYQAPDGLISLDRTLIEKCNFITRVFTQDAPTPRQLTEGNKTRLQREIKYSLKQLGRFAKQFSNDVVPLLGSNAKVHIPSEFWVNRDQGFRHDFWVSWRNPKGVQQPGIRLRVHGNGAFLVLNPEVGWTPSGFGAEMLKATPTVASLGFFTQFVDGRPPQDLIKIDRQNVQADFNFGVKLNEEQLRSANSGANEIRDALSELKLPFEQITRTMGDSGGANQRIEMPDSAMQEKANRFASQNPDSELDQKHREIRDEFAAWLSPENLPNLSKRQFRRIYASSYGNPGPMASLHTSVTVADEAEWNRIIRSIDYLLRGPGEVADRIDDLLTKDQYRINGLGEAVATKLLAIVNPEVFLPVYVTRGDKGRLKLIDRLGLARPEAETAGEEVVETNRVLRNLTEPLFPGDPWRQMRFLYWCAQSSSELEKGDPDELYLSERFIDELIVNLKQKRQVILYGPPGTGKTFVAKQIAKTLVNDEAQVSFVQFHPSTSYEDFFEGYRPVADSESLKYAKQRGPLRLIADEASADPGGTYVLIIDEINRANVPKVFGELMYLLEYRAESVSPLYSPEEDFTLPENLYIIATMNTVDRSVSILDMALRRRFRFISFMLDEEDGVGQVLEKWVAQRGEWDELPIIVETLNDKLRKELGSENHLFGPSYFMHPGIDRAQLDIIWRQEVDPMISELFYANPEKATEFKLANILKEIESPSLESA